MTIREKIQKSGQPLCEVKAGQSGMGLLVERDFHIIGNDDMVNQIKEDIQTEKKFVIPDRFIVNAIFQKYGVKNANGRIYPENVLKPEVERYIREKINGFGNCAIGSADHPSSCQLAGTQILTKYGWKLIEDVTTEDEVLTVTENKKIEIKKVIRKIDEPYNGDLVHIKGRHIDLEVTPNHKFPILDRNKKFKGFFTAEELYYGLVPDQSHCYLFKTGEWEGEDDDEFVIDALPQSEIDKIYQKYLKEKYSKELHIPMKTWAKFLGIYLSEGCCTNGRVNIYQKKKEVCEQIEEMLSEFPLYYSVNEKSCNEANVYSIQDLRLARYLSQFGKCYDKYVPYEMKKQGKETLRTFYDWFVLGDGRKRGWITSKNYSDDVFSTSKRLVMDLNEIQLKIGYSGAYHEEDRHHDRYIEGRLIEGKNSQNMHFTYRSLSDGVLLGKLSIEKRHYDGRVYCIEVPNHTFYTMDKKGHCVWSGNSSLSIHDVSHKILNLKWQGCTLLGEMELHLSPGYRKYGVCSTSGDLVANLILDGILVGVSSRALGNVIDKYGTLIVDDDLELIGWDCVIENSTPGAHIFTNPNDMSQFIESKEQDENKQQIQESKLDRLNKILLF